MDIYQNVSVPGGIPLEFQQEKAPSSSSSSISKFEEFFPGENMEGEDVSLQWLSIFVEDCLSSTTQCLLPPPTNNNQKQSPPPPQAAPSQNPKTPLQDLAIPSKSRTKRRRVTPNNSYSNDFHHIFHLPPQDPPLLHQEHWMADSELLYFPKKDTEERPTPATKAPKAAAAPKLVEKEEYEEEEEEEEKMGCVQPRRCTHCLSQKTPQWRAGPMGPKTLCNACGVRFKSGRLLPEYRPAKSPTFVSYKHSNSHKKVMEMRMAVVSSHAN